MSEAPRSRSCTSLRQRRYGETENDGTPLDETRGEARTDQHGSRIDHGYRLRYQDPDFDNKWMELAIRDATRLSVKITTAVTRESPSTWRYDYEVTNSTDCDQQAAWWRMQVQTGTQIVLSPPGWESALSTDRLSRLTSIATAVNEIGTGLTATGWSIVSDSLPEAREAEVCGALQIDAKRPDVPAHVRQYLTELGSKNTLRANTIAPWIATRQVARGRTGPIPASSVGRPTATREIFHLDRRASWRMRDAL
jgi:hypothetical protein